MCVYFVAMKKDSFFWKLIFIYGMDINVRGYRLGHLMQTEYLYNDNNLTSLKLKKRKKIKETKARPKENEI